ncbi:MAG: hypothetical protein CMK07_10910 [Ponticaulis sp.]|nr:hypothetical protein [Ponticaulis sp.]
MTPDWKTLESRLGVEGLEDFNQREVVARLEDLEATSDIESHQKAIKALSGAFGFAFFGFFICFSVLAMAVPDYWWTIVLKFVLFPVMFFGFLAIAAFLKRDTLMKVLFRAQETFIVRSAALTSLAEKLGLTYVPAPGGAPESLKALAKLKFLSKRLNALTDLLDAHGGQEDTVEAAIASGLIVPDTVVLGSEEDKARFYRQTAMGQAFEDGFEGQIGDIRFSAMEWIETVDEAPDRYHLLVALKAPFRLQGVTQFRARKTPWPKHPDEGRLEDVDLVPDTFNAHFRLRSSDQVEARTLFHPAVVERVLALAHGDPFRAVAQGNWLLIDIVGDNRFNLVDIRTGVWSHDTIRQTYEDIADLREFVEIMAHAFTLRE